MKFKVWVSSIIILTAISGLEAGTSGKISGQVTNQNSGDPLIGVNVIIDGTSLGAATDVNGNYSILNIAPGIYTVNCSAIGYKKISATSVSVSIDLTSRVDFQMEVSAVEMDEILVVVHKKPMVTKDLTASTAVVKSDDIEAMPINNVTELLKMQAGMIDGHARGGRSGEILYTVDGVPMTDVYDGSQVIEVNKNMVNELQFVSGAFNAEYGKAMSGIVNIVTKDADNSLRFGIDSYIGGHYSQHTDIFRGINKYNPLATRNLEGYLNFPVIKDRIYFFGNFRKYYTDGWINAKYVFNPWDITYNLGASYEPQDRYIFQSTGDSSLVPMNWEDRTYFHGKLFIKPTAKITLNWNSIVDKKDWQEYNHYYAYNPYGDINRHSLAYTNSITMTHMLSTRTFYQAILSTYTRDYRHYVYENPYDSLYTNYLLLAQAPSEIPSFLTGGTNAAHFYRTTRNYLAKMDVTSQINSFHQVKFGGELVRYRLDYKYYTLLQESGIADPEDSGNPFVDVYIPDPDNPEENTEIDIYARKPVEASAYLQDKIEFKNIIINIGLRYDFFDANGFVLNDPTDPDIYRPRKDANIAETLDERQSHWYKNSTPKFSLSPRLGLAFPITASGVVHCSYGIFYQAPSFELLYANPEFKFTEATGNLGIAGNSDLEPEKTVSGELGVKQGITPDMAVELTAYFRDISNLAGTRADEITIYGGTSWYNQYENSDFGLVRGVVIALDKRLSDSWSAALDYTYQVAEGDASDPNAIRNQIIAGNKPEVQMIRLDFDQTHTINFNLNYISPKNWGIGLVGQYGSGLPYTPEESIDLSKLLTNSETKPEYFNLNLNLFKTFLYHKTSFKLYVRVYNLLDRLNELSVYDDSGTANYTWEEYYFAASGTPELVNTLGEYYRNPGYYSEPRRIEFGVAIDWNKK